MIGIIDYGAGNLKSVQNALTFLGARHFVSSDPGDFTGVAKMILPGVGAFGDAMRALRQRKLDRAIYDFIDTGRPFLGICLGLQVLFEQSSESVGVPGLGVFAGTVQRFPSDLGLKVPHIGWNSLAITSQSQAVPNNIFTGIGADSYAYFVHSYYVKAADPTIVTAVTNYGIDFHAAVGWRNVQACQFHPEKSGDVGIAMLKNFTSQSPGHTGSQSQRSPFSGPLSTEPPSLPVSGRPSTEPSSTES